MITKEDIENKAIIIENDCWYYPSSRLHYKRSYELYIGPIPEGYIIVHKCRYYKCINPAHLELKTPTLYKTGRKWRKSWKDIPYDHHIGR